MQDANCFTKLAVVGLIAAIRSMQLVMARDGSLRDFNRLGEIASRAHGR
jgi:hypothetical protein